MVYWESHNLSDADTVAHCPFSHLAGNSWGCQVPSSSPSPDRSVMWRDWETCEVPAKPWVGMLLAAWALLNRFARFLSQNPPEQRAKSNNPEWDTQADAQGDIM